MKFDAKKVIDELGDFDPIRFIMLISSICLKERISYVLADPESEEREEPQCIWDACELVAEVAKRTYQGQIVWDESSFLEHYDNGLFREAYFDAWEEAEREAELDALIEASVEAELEAVEDAWRKEAELDASIADIH